MAVPNIVALDAIRADQARLNVTWGGENGDLPDPLGNDLSDEEVRAAVLEALQTGYIPGIPADGGITAEDLRDFVVERFAANEEVPFARLVCRPKTPFGA